MDKTDNVIPLSQQSFIMYNLAFLDGWIGTYPKLPEVKYFLYILKMIISYKIVLKAWILFRIKTSYISHGLHANTFFHT